MRSRQPARDNLRSSNMDGLAVTGTPGQLLLLALAASIDGLDACMQQQCGDLKADVWKLEKRIPQSADMQGNPLVLLRPPADETVEEEAQRLVRDIKDKGNIHHKTQEEQSFRQWREYWGEYNRDMSSEVRHAETKATLEKIGFNVRGWKSEWTPFSETCLQWKR